MQVQQHYCLHSPIYTTAIMDYLSFSLMFNQGFNRQLILINNYDLMLPHRIRNLNSSFLIYQTGSFSLEDNLENIFLSKHYANI